MVGVRSDPIDIAGADGLVALALADGDALLILEVVAGELGWLDVAIDDARLAVRYR